MKCPKCYSNTKVMDSRSLNDKRVRFRKCERCGHMFYTSETEIPHEEGYEILSVWYGKAKGQKRGFNAKY